MKLLGKTLFIVGVILLIFSMALVWRRHDPNRLKFEVLADEFVNDTKQGTMPVRLEIPSVGINNAIIPSKINGSRWEVTSKGVSYLTTSATPGETGNSVFYGHNWDSVLGNLPKVQPGDEIIIGFSDGSQKTFMIDRTQVVEPTNVWIIKDTTDSILTIYTCTGLFDMKRFVAVAVPV